MDGGASMPQSIDDAGAHDMSTPYEWRINDIEQKAERACRSLHEVDSLRGDVARLEYAVRALRTESDELRARLAV